MTRDELVKELVEHGCHEARPSPSGSRTLTCPLCENGNPHGHHHLSVTEGKEGRVLVKCHHGCNVADVLACVGRTWNDLFPESETPPEPCILATYDYTDEAGADLFQVVRLEPKDFRQRHRDARQPDGWAWNMNGVRRVPYRLPALLEGVQAGERIIITEGEKDADRGAAIGLVTTCNPGGADRWRPEYNAYFTGADVVVIADRDADVKAGKPHRKGQRHAADVARNLVGVAKSVAVLELPDRGARKVKDLADWLDAGGTHDELDALTRERAVEGATYARLEDERREQAVEGSVDAVGSVAGVQEWAPPIPFAERDLPPFPVGDLPAWVREYVEAVAVAVQVPADLVALDALGALATAVGGKVEVEIKPGYTEPANLFLCCPLPSANRKSAALVKAYGPVFEVQAEMVAEAVADIAEAKIKHELAEDRLKAAKSKAVRATDSTERAEAEHNALMLADDLARLEIPAEPRLVVDDVTPEKLGVMMAEQHGRLALASAEGGIFDIIAGRYSDGVPNLDVFLKGHAGDFLSVDRLGRPPVVIPRPALVIVLSPQPDVVAKLARVPGFRGRGLIARFLFAIPRSLVGGRDVDPPSVPEQLEATYKHNLRALLWLPVPHEPHRLQVQAGARALWLDFSRWLEPQLAEGTPLAPVADWGGKLAGAVARIAALLCIGDRAGLAEPWREPVPPAVMARAIRIGLYLIPHALAAFDLMGADPLMAHALHALRWIRRERLQRFTTRDAHRALEHRLPRVADVEQVLAVLAERGFIRHALAERQPKIGRPPSPVWEVNPCDETDNTDRTPAEHEGAQDSVGSVGSVARGSTEIPGEAVADATTEPEQVEATATDLAPVDESNPALWYAVGRDGPTEAWEAWARYTCGTTDRATPPDGWLDHLRALARAGVAYADITAACGRYRAELEAGAHVVDDWRRVLSVEAVRREVAP